MGRGRVVLGAGSSADVVVSDPAVSDRHLELEPVRDGVVVRDLASRTGTYFLDQRVGEIVLTSSATLRVGATLVAVDLDCPDDLFSCEIPSFRGIVGGSHSMRRLFDTVTGLDGTKLPLLVSGETGVGKELVARAIHEGSRGSAGTFVTIDCRTMSVETASRTLFGYQSDVPTGPIVARQGAFAAACHGTLLLDEVGELPLEVQPALLRVLDNGEILPIGADMPVPVTTRVIASTKRDLLAAVRAGTFREDLYYRLSVGRIDVPPLRHRREDVPMLALFFALHDNSTMLSRGFVEDLSARDYPGNVRELRNIVLSHLVLGGSSERREPRAISRGRARRPHSGR